VISVRLVQPEEAERLAEWVVSNQHLDYEDARQAFRENPLTFLIVINGIDVVFFPVWIPEGTKIAKVGFFGFNPESTKEERLKSLNASYTVLIKFLEAYNLNEMQFKTTAKDSYPMIRWGRTRGMQRIDETTLSIRI